MEANATTEKHIMRAERSLRVTVMLGGPSAEREVSLRSGHGVATALRAIGHHVSELDPRAENWCLPSGTDVVFLALHGTYGEDGTVQQRLDELGILYTGCGPLASRTAFDKAAAKRRLQDRGVRTPRFEVIESAVAGWPEDWGPPVVLKPTCQGSSVGLEFVRERGAFIPALERSLGHGGPVLMEEMIAGRELTVGILDGEALPLVEIRPRTGVYDYRTKYTEGATDYLCPAPLGEAEAREVQEAGLKAFEAIGGRDYGRVDVLLDEQGRPSVLEVNTLPGMTATSLLPKAANAAGISYETLCQRMIELALERAPEKR